MTFNLFDLITENNEENSDHAPAQSLSAQATQEILGENLCVLFAIGKNGQIVRFYPNTVDLKAKDLEFKNLQIPEEYGEDSIPLLISVRMPKNDLNITEYPETKELGLVAKRRCCVWGGTPHPC